jgi:hypothetical protein
MSTVYTTDELVTLQGETQVDASLKEQQLTIGRKPLKHQQNNKTKQPES